jgi:serine/threonine-protein kinase RsbT
MQTEFERILEALKRHISPARARALLLKALQEQGLSADTLTRQELRRCSPSLRRGISLCTAEARREAALRDVSEACGSDSLQPSACALDVMTEADIGLVRAEARRVCDSVGVGGFTLQKVATIVSELARNMLLYAKGGQLEIVPANGARRIIVRATDQGPGIRNLEEIFSGRYRSKTGLGKGLFGTKRLADHFDIVSGPAGTRIVVEIAL